MKVCVIGIGYIGLPTACILAHNNFQVLGVDIDLDHIDNIKDNSFITDEKGLKDLLFESLESKNLVLKNQPEDGDVFLICVPTPLSSDKKADLTYLKSALYSILPFIKKNNIVIIESTIPPFTIKNIVKPILETCNLIVGEDISLAYCPERVAPNNIIFELIYNNRIVGGFTPHCSKLVKDFYKEFVLGEISTTSSEIAEMVKLVENSYRDVNIALSNEIAMICTSLNIDPYEVIRLANKHPRVDLLDFGIGVGGHCLPVDSYFLIENAPNLSNMLNLSRIINDNMPKYIVERIEDRIKHIANPKIAIWGLAYKPNTDDIRNSPSMEIFNILLEKGYNVLAYDPFIKNHLTQDKYKTIDKAHILLVLVDHEIFREEDYELIIEKMEEPIIFHIKKINLNNLESKITFYDLLSI